MDMPIKSNAIEIYFFIAAHGCHGEGGMLYCIRLGCGASRESGSRVKVPHSPRYCKVKRITPFRPHGREKAPRCKPTEVRRPSRE